MSALSKCQDPGVLLVLSQPTSPRFLSDFHDWYNTEHGPARLMLGDEYFSNGYRYKGAGDDAIWLAIYDMKRLSAGTEKDYTTLRENRSAREKEVLRHKTKVLSREFLRLVAGPANSCKPAKAIIVVRFEVDKDDEHQMKKWYEQKMFDIMRGNCSRSRLFKLVDGTDFAEDRVLYLGIHDVEVSAFAHTESTRSRAADLISCNSMVQKGWTIRSFEFYRKFLAHEYQAPSQIVLQDSTQRNGSGDLKL